MQLPSGGGGAKTSWRNALRANAGGALGVGMTVEGMVAALRRELVER